MVVRSKECGWDEDVVVVRSGEVIAQVLAQETVPGFNRVCHFFRPILCTVHCAPFISCNGSCRGVEQFGMKSISRSYVRS